MLKTTTKKKKTVFVLSAFQFFQEMGRIYPPADLSQCFQGSLQKNLTWMQGKSLFGMHVFLFKLFYFYFENAKIHKTLFCYMKIVLNPLFISCSVFVVLYFLHNYL